MSAEFKPGQKVRFVHGTRPSTIISVTRDDTSYFYDIAFYSEGVVHRVAESSLVLLEGD